MLRVEHNMGRENISLKDKARVWGFGRPPVVAFPLHSSSSRGPLGRWNWAQTGKLLVFTGINTHSGRSHLAEAFCDLPPERTQNPNHRSRRTSGCRTISLLFTQLLGLVLREMSLVKTSEKPWGLRTTTTSNFSLEELEGL